MLRNPGAGDDAIDPVEDPEIPLTGAHHVGSDPVHCGRVVVEDDNLLPLILEHPEGGPPAGGGTDDEDGHPIPPEVMKSP